MSDNRSAFEVFDSDGDAALNEEELGYVLRSMGHNPSQKQLSELTANCSDPTHISRADMTRVTLAAPKAPSSGYEKDLVEAFRVFDRDDNGLITENDIRVIFTTLGEVISLEEVNSLLEQVQIDDNGKVKYTEFVKMLLKP